jgi:hypothetical protein
MFSDKPVLSRGVESWISKKCPGTPAFLEAMFILMEKGLRNSSAFRTGLSYLNASESEVEEWFLMWRLGLLHPEISKRRNDLTKPYLEALCER